MIIPDPNEYLQRSRDIPRTETRLEKARRENQELMARKARQQQDNLEATEAEVLEKANEQLRKELEGEFEDACQFDETMRDGVVRIGKARLKGKAFLHRSCAPLRDVDLRSPEEKGQMDLFGNECDGVCGV